MAKTVVDHNKCIIDDLLCTFVIYKVIFEKMPVLLNIPKIIAKEKPKKLIILYNRKGTFLEPRNEISELF